MSPVLRTVCRPRLRLVRSLRPDIPDYHIERIGEFVNVRDTNIKVQLFDVIADFGERAMRRLAQRHGSRRECCRAGVRRAR